MKDIKNNAFLILTKRQTTLNSIVYKDIERATKSFGNTILLYHNENNTDFCDGRNYNIFTFTYEKLNELNFNPIGEYLIPGNNHFPLLFFFNKYPDYEYYWLIEDDVAYTGSWNTFFKFFYSVEFDFVSCHLRMFNEEPNWLWWDSLMHTKTYIPLTKRVRSFNPIYCISRSGLRFLNDSMLDNWTGHHEVLIPTLLFNYGYKILDFGGSGKFVLNGLRNKYYTSFSSDNKGYLNKGTMRYRPAWTKVGAKENKLYHPVKKQYIDKI